MCLALAFVPVQVVTNSFRQLKNSAPAYLHEFLEFFETKYVEIMATGRRHTTALKYAIELWNQYQAVLDDLDAANNVSEGWHNRFRIVVAKQHPDLYSALKEFKKKNRVILTQGKSI